MRICLHTPYPSQQGGGALLPPLKSDLLQWLTGDGDKLDIVNPEPEVCDVSCMEYTGLTGIYTDTGLVINRIHQTGIYAMSFWMWLPDTSDQFVGGCQGASSQQGFSLSISSGKLKLVFSNGTSYFSPLYGVAVKSGWQFAQMWGTGQTQFVDIDGAQDSGDVTGAFGTGDSYGTLRLGRRGYGTSYFTGKLHDFNFSDEFHYPLEEDSGLPQDISGNSNHATANTATWTTADGIDSHAKEFGYSKLDAGRTEEHEYGTASTTFIKIGTTSYATISNAITAASPGDTILLGKGTYSENVVLPDGVSLQGTLNSLHNDTSGTVLDGYLRLVHNSTASGLVVKYGGAVGVGLSGYNNVVRNIVTLGSNTVDHGVLLTGDGNTVENCTTVGCQYHGIAVKGKNHLITQNMVDAGAFTGIIVKADAVQSDNNTTHDIIVSNNTVNGKTSVRTFAGIHLESYDTDSVVSNISLTRNYIKGGSQVYSYGLEMQAHKAGGEVTSVTAVDNAIEESSVGWFAYPNVVGSSVDVTLGTLFLKDVTTPSSSSGSGTIAVDVEYVVTDDLFSYIPALEEKTSAIVTFDGVAAQLKAPFSLNYGEDDFEIAIETTIGTVFESNPSALLYSLDGTNDGIRIHITYTGTFYCSINTKDIIFNDSSLIGDGVQHVFGLSRVGDTLKMFVDGVLKGSVDVAGEIVSTTTVCNLFSAPAGSHLSGSIKSFKASGYCDCDVSGILGKTATTIPDTSGNGNDLSVITGAGGLDSAWSKRVTDSSGVFVDAQYNLRRISGGYVHNGGNYSLRQSPTQTGMPALGTHWVDGSGGDLKLSWSDLLSIQNLTKDSAMKFVKKNGVCLLSEMLQWPIGRIDSMTDAEYKKLIRWIGDLTCGTFCVTDNGQIVTDNGKCVTNRE